MKHLILMALLAVLVIGCDKEEDREEQQTEVIDNYFSKFDYLINIKIANKTKYDLSFVPAYLDYKKITLPSAQEYRYNGAAVDFLQGFGVKQDEPNIANGDFDILIRYEENGKRKFKPFNVSRLNNVVYITITNNKAGEFIFTVN